MKSLLVSVTAFFALLSASEANAVTLGPGDHVFIQFDTSVAPFTGTARVNVSPIEVCPIDTLCSIEVFFSTGLTVGSSPLIGKIGIGASSPITDSVDLFAHVVTRGDRTVSVEAFTTVFDGQNSQLLPLEIEVRDSPLPPGLISTIPLPATIPLFLSALGLLFIGGWKRKIVEWSGSHKPSGAVAV